MRRDYVIAIILAVASLPAGATLMVAPEYLHLTGVAVPLTFLGGIGLTAALLSLAAWVALRAGTEDKHPVSHLCKTATRDVSLLDAIWRVFMGVWGERKRFWDGGDPNQNPDFGRFWIACDDVRQKAFEGALPIWATRKNSQLY